MSCADTLPVASLNAELGVSEPRPDPAVLNVTTCPGATAPVASRTTAVSVAGVPEVIAVEDKDNVIEGAPVVVGVVLGVT